MNASVQCLTQSLQAELAEYGALLHLFEQQQQCVLRHDSGAYLQMTHEVDEQMATLGRCRVLRQGMASAVARECNRMPETPIRELTASLPVPERQLLLALTEEINRLVERTRRRAEQNQLLLARCIDTARGVVAALRPGETYSARGQVQPFHQRPGGVAVAVA
jgi:hypothetical protein